MHNKKGLLIFLCLILIVGMLGCSSGGSGGGGGTTPPPAQTPTQKLIGTWNLVSSSDQHSPSPIIFRADGTGTFSGTGFSAGRIDNGVFYFTLDSGQDEAFDITWNSDNNITLTNHNGGSRYTYSRA